MNVFRNNRGFSLAELMVASGIAVLLTTVATFAFSMAMSVFVRTARLVEAETEMMGALYALKSAYAQSVNVIYGGDAAASMVAGQPNAYTAREAAAAKPRDATQGKLFTTNFNATTPSATPSTYMISLTVREMNSGFNSAGANAPNSLFYGTGIYFQAPSFTRSGALYVDQETNAGTGSPSPGGWVILSPVGATQAFTRLTEFHVDNLTVMSSPGGVVSTVGTTDDSDVFTDTAVARSGFAGQTVLSAQISLNMRYFTSGQAGNTAGTIASDWRWCPTSFMYDTANGVAATAAGCDNAKTRSNYRDIQKKLKVVFSNNSYNRDKYLVERPMGYVYFFKSWAPTQGKVK
jgi:Tfp pilus assembly protein PilE